MDALAKPPKPPKPPGSSAAATTSTAARRLSDVPTPEPDDEEAELDFDDTDALRRHSVRMPGSSAADDLARAVEHYGQTARMYLTAAHLQRYPCDEIAGANHLIRVHGIVFQAASSSATDVFNTQRLCFLPDELAEYVREVPELLADQAPTGADDSAPPVMSKFLFWDTTTLRDPPAAIVDKRYGPPPVDALYYNQYDECLLMEALGNALFDHNGDERPNAEKVATSGGKLKVPQHIMRVYLTHMFELESKAQERSLKSLDFYVGVGGIRSRKRYLRGGIFNVDYRNVSLPAVNYPDLLELIEELHDKVARARRREAPAPGDLAALDADAKMTPAGAQAGPVIDLAADTSGSEFSVDGDVGSDDEGDGEGDCNEDDDAWGGDDEGAGAGGGSGSRHKKRAYKVRAVSSAWAAVANLSSFCSFLQAK